MVTLTIKKPDGSTYWVEHFNDRAACDKWLSEEKSRPYWQASLTPQIDEQPPQVPTPLDPTKEQAKLDRLTRLKAANLAGALTIADLKLVLKDIVDHMVGS